MLRTSKLILVGLFVVVVFIVANPVFASLKLEQNYPDVVSVKAITHKTTVPQLIKYYLTWAIIIAILVVITSLIIAGAQYAFSTGKPALMKKARAQLLNSFLGLAILVSAYLVLLVINPQAAILTLNKAPVESGIVLLTQDGFDKLKVSNTTFTLQTLIENNQAYYLSYQSNDLTQYLGKFWLDPSSGAKANFQDFPAFAIGFWGQNAKTIKAMTYSDKDLKGIKTQYVAGGKIDETGAIISPSVKYGSNPEVWVIVLDPDDFLKSKVEVEIEDPVSKEKKTIHQTVFHPFLSLTTEGIGPGVYLLSDKEQRYFSKPGFFGDFSQELDFDDKAEHLKIINSGPPDSGGTDYLAVLYIDKDFKGTFRLFFQQRDKSIIPKIYSDGKTNSNTAWTVIDLDKLKQEPGYFKDSAYVVDTIQYKLGNVPQFILGQQEEGININTKDLYGNVANVSSMKIFNLEKVESSSCREVKLCQGPDFTGYCLSYTPNGREVGGEYQTLTLPLSWYAPVNIPKKMTGTVKTQQGMEKIGSNNNENEFANNIRSIEITGNCLVVLFEYSLLSLGLEDCLTGDPCWGGEIGAHSEIFTATDADLTDNLVGVCTTRVLGIKMGDASPCASAIVVYPVK